MDCPKCGKEYADSFKFCPACGESSPEVEKSPTSSPEQPIVAGESKTPLPPADQQPPAKKSKSRGKVIAIAVVSVAIILILTLCIVLGLMLSKGYETKAKTEADTFIQNALKKDYDAQYKQISPESRDLMWIFMVSPKEESDDWNTDIGYSEKAIEDFYAGSTGFLSGMFGGDSLKPFMQDGDLSSAKATRINSGTFYVELLYKGASEPLPLFIKKQDDTFSVDFAATLAMSDPSLAQDVKGVVEGLIKDPTTENLDTAKRILDKSARLKSELELWLKKGPKGILSASRITEIEDAVSVASEFGELYSEVMEKIEALLTKDSSPKASVPSETTTAQSSEPSKPKKKQEPKTKTTAIEDTPEYKCASIQKGFEVDVDDPLVSSFKSVFDSLQTKYPNDTRISFADTVVTAKEQIDTKTTVKTTLLEVAQEIDGSSTLEAAQAGISLNEIAAAYITILISYYGK